MKDWNARRRLKTTAKLVLLSQKRTKDIASVVSSRMLTRHDTKGAEAGGAAPSVATVPEASGDESEGRVAEPTAAE